MKSPTAFQVAKLAGLIALGLLVVAVGGYAFAYFSSLVGIRAMTTHTSAGFSSSLVYSSLRRSPVS
jgi:hypothetical protein